MLALCVVLLAASLASAQVHYKVYYSNTSSSFYTQPAYPPGTRVATSDSDLYVLSGYLGNDTTHTGWFRLALDGVKGVPDTLMMGGAGYLEGLLTSPLIDEAIANYA